MNKKDYLIINNLNSIISRKFRKLPAIYNICPFSRHKKWPFISSFLFAIYPSVNLKDNNKLVRANV